MQLSPALAGMVQGVVVQMAKDKSGKNSPNKPLEVEGALTNLKVTYMLFETCPSGYCIWFETREWVVQIRKSSFNAYHANLVKV